MTGSERLEEKKGLTFFRCDSGLMSERPCPTESPPEPLTSVPPTLGSSTVQRLLGAFPGSRVQRWGSGVGAVTQRVSPEARPLPRPHRPQPGVMLGEEAPSPDARTTGFCHLLTSSRNNLLPWNQAIKKFSLYSLNRRCVNRLQRKVSAGKGSCGHAF